MVVNNRCDKEEELTKMASKAECKRCGSLVWIPQGTQAFQCSACGAVTRLRLTTVPRYYTYPPPPPPPPPPNYTMPMPYGGRVAPRYAPPPPPPPPPTPSRQYMPTQQPSGPQPQYSYASPQRQQFSHSPVSPPPPPRRVPSIPTPAFGRKKAFICGINYYGKFKLQGSVNDAKNMRNLLIECFGFQLNSIWMQTDEDKDPMNRPTKQNMVRALEWLVEDCKSGDSLVFFFSGHGSRVADESYDELDGYDESLCPLDFKTAGKLVDDEINEIIVRPLPPNVKLHAIVDTCFSGTVLDLQHVCKKSRDGRFNWEFHGHPDKVTSGGHVVCISACDDHQNSADTTAFSGSKDDVAGALTHSFSEAVRNDSTGLTYARLLGIIDHAVRKAHSSVTPDDQFNPHSFQEPQVSSSAPFDIYNTKFTL